MSDGTGPRAPLVPENAPFDEEQRAWLNGFLAGVLGLAANEARVAVQVAQAAGAAAGAAARAPNEPGPASSTDSDSQERRLRSALAQLDCGQCGYSCQGYARALAEGSEQDTSLCVPGGAATRESLESMLADPARAPRSPRPRASAESGVSLRSVGRDALAPGLAPAAPAASGAPPDRRSAQRLRVKSQRRLTFADAGSEIREVVLDLTGSQLSYRAGDSLAVFPHNDPDLVRALLRALGARGREP